MKRWLLSALLGAVFGTGLAVSGMTQPAKVIGFLDVTRSWDPTLAFVMAGAIVVFSPLYSWIVRRWGGDPSFLHPVKGRIDAPLVLGSMLFGVGWGMAGYCPGPGITCVGTGTPHALVFFVTLFTGMVLFRAYRNVASAVGRETHDVAVPRPDAEPNES